jgi:hypothetical protein
MTDDQWFDQYKPVANPTGESGFCVGEDSFLFETYGNDLEKIQNQDEINPNTVWSYQESESDDKMLIVSGFHPINTLGYLITEIPFNDNEFIEIVCE